MLRTIGQKERKHYFVHIYFYTTVWFPGGCQHLPSLHGPGALGVTQPSCASVPTWNVLLLARVRPGSAILCWFLSPASPFNDITHSPEIGLYLPSCLIAKQRSPAISQQCCHQRALFHRGDNAINKIFSKCVEKAKATFPSGNQ